MDAVTTFEGSFEAKGTGCVQRLDVIPAGPARRRWTAEAKARIISESLAPEANISEVARRHQILPQQLYAWRRAAAERMSRGDAAAFVPALVAPGRVPEPCTASAGAEVRIELHGVCVFVPESASADHVERVLLAVRVML